MTTSAERVSPLAQRRIAVTGALGFVAGHLIPRLQARGARVIALVRAGRDTRALEASGCVTRHADLSADTPSSSWFEGCDAVVHLSGIAQASTLVPAIEAAGARRAVFVGSAGVYTKLESRGADAKRRGEARIRESSLEWTILRPSMIYGTLRDRNIARLLRWLDRWPVVPVPGGGRTPQQPVHVEDLADAVVAALERDASARREYDVAGPDALPLAELIRESARALGRTVWLIPVPLSPAHWVARSARRLGLRFPISPEQVLRLDESKAADIEPARHDLDFAPTSSRRDMTSISLRARSARASKPRRASSARSVAGELRSTVETVRGPLDLGESARAARSRGVCDPLVVYGLTIIGYDI